MEKLKLRIEGMHCASCEVLVERKWKKIHGVEHVNVNHATGKAEVVCSRKPSLLEFASAVQKEGYRVQFTHSDDASQETREPEKRSRKKEYLEIGAAFVILYGLYQILKELDLVPAWLGISESMSLGIVFLIGLVAAFSTCMAVTGGLLLAISAKFNEQYPHLSRKEKMRPHLYFNLGRIVSYTVLGGLVGSVGSLFVISPKVTGVFTVIASIMMVLLGLQILNLFPWLRRFQFRLPKLFVHRVAQASEGTIGKRTPFLFGASTFFFPCGFTQSLQLYVLSQGSFWTGASTMFFFALGTLPALLSIGAIASISRGTFYRYFLRFSGALVVVLGIFNVRNGLALTTVGSVLGAQDKEIVQGVEDPNVKIVDGKQIVAMTVRGLSYSPSRFRVLAGIPVEWRIDGTAAQGCAQVIIAPKIDVTEYLRRDGITTIEFTPQEVGMIGFSCTMGMTTRGSAFEVLPNNGVPSVEKPKIPSPSCDPNVMICNVQKLSMEISREKGFSPNVFTVKKNVPVELEIDTKVPLGGCMGTMVLTDYNRVHRLTLGKTTFRFTPTKEGTSVFTCSMGSPLGEFTVIN